MGRIWVAVPVGVGVIVGVKVGEMIGVALGSRDVGVEDGRVHPAKDKIKMGVINIRFISQTSKGNVAVIVSDKLSVD